MHSNRYILLFVLAMTTIVAVILAFMSTALAPYHKKNEEIYNKRAILAAVEPFLDKKVKEMTDEEVQGIFDQSIDQHVIDMDGSEVGESEIATRGYSGTTAESIDMAKERKLPEDDRYLPVFVYNDGGTKYYIVSVRGNGLWDEIWGNIALNDDFNTIAGTAFDHKGETPGLGAEIKDNPNFPKSFVGKKLYDGDEYVSIEVVKGGAKKDDIHGVDGITGATITADGVTEMLYRGLKYYEPYFEKEKNN